MWPQDIGGVHHEPSYWLYYSMAGLAIEVFMAVLLSVYNAINQRIACDLRNLSPLQLWLMIVPAFGSIWIFYVIWQNANALSEEFKRRKIIEFETYPGLGIGWAFSFFCATAQLTLLLDDPGIPILLGIATVILFVIFLVKLAGFKDKLDKDALNEAHLVPPPPPQYTYPNYQQPVQQQPDYTQQQFPPGNYPPPQNPEPYQPNDWERWKPK